MKLLIIFLAIFLIILISSCELQQAEESKNRMMVCTDTRDGEVFRYNTNNITNIHMSISGVTSFNITTTNGDIKLLKSSMEVYLKCKVDLHKSSEVING